MEGVQRRATKIIPNLHNKPYQERLQKLKLYSMEYRRKRGEMIQVYKIIDRVEPTHFFKQMHSRNTRGHNMKLFKERSHSELRKQSFSQRIINDWNSLTESIVSAESINSFKARLDKHWKDDWYKISTEE